MGRREGVGIGFDGCNGGGVEIDEAGHHANADEGSEVEDDVEKAGDEAEGTTESGDDFGWIGFFEVGEEGSEADGDGVEAETEEGNHEHKENDALSREIQHITGECHQEDDGGARECDIEEEFLVENFC